jgi:hypothetical protein
MFEKQPIPLFRRKYAKDWKEKVLFGNNFLYNEIKDKANSLTRRKIIRKP